ncbi:hypothetical protein [Rhodospirillaceae bacterium SYSU D60014]|uniref:hypothetical protein n=1 Tax=Virgifigura deserti TaxID=2268457 RepID=UPI000E6602F0
MNVYDPRDWQGSRNGDPTDPNIDSLIRCGLAVALCLCLASFYPWELVPAVLSLFLLLAALGISLVATVCEERLDPPHLSRWDEAAACMALSLLLKILFPVQPLAQAAAAGP